jgi:hypothetical protein
MSRTIFREVENAVMSGWRRIAPVCGLPPEIVSIREKEMLTRTRLPASGRGEASSEGSAKSRGLVINAHSANAKPVEDAQEVSVTFLRPSTLKRQRQNELVLFKGQPPT